MAELCRRFPEVIDEWMRTDRARVAVENGDEMAFTVRQLRWAAGYRFRRGLIIEAEKLPAESPYAAVLVTRLGPMLSQDA